MKINAKKNLQNSIYTENEVLSVNQKIDSAWLILSQAMVKGLGIPQRFA